MFEKIDCSGFLERFQFYFPRIEFPSYQTMISRVKGNEVPQISELLIKIETIKNQKKENFHLTLSEDAELLYENYWNISQMRCSQEKNPDMRGNSKFKF
jgi:hypothetical protein